MGWQTATTRRSFVQTGLAAAAAARIPAKTVVLTFDDAVKSHSTFVAPLLKELGFNATFFVTHEWMSDRENFMTWQDIAGIHRLGFEIGNHTWTHLGVSDPRGTARLAGDLALVEFELKKAGVPRPESFAYPGNGFGPEAVAVLQRLGFRYARRGGQPEVPYGKMEIGAPFDPRRHHPLLIPTTADAYPDWTLAHFQKAVARAVDGEIVVLQFHGVPDSAHPWVHTPPERFREYMQWLKREGFRTLALRDVGPFLPAVPPDDPMLKARHPARDATKVALSPEMAATRADLPHWRGVMALHNYSVDEMSAVTGLAEAPPPDILREELKAPAILPYPGGRHPRIGFQEGEIDPQRGTKASVFFPADPFSYALVDLPEAIFSNLGLIYLAHTHIPTYWNERNVAIPNVDWQRTAGGLRSEWKLPNGISFGASIEPADVNRVSMELWLHNGTPDPLTGLRTQICVMLKGARAFARQAADNKR
ncbi:MAG: polysaccharide deacetylase family protein, partial [Bryobacteraceae bacterium]